MPQELNTTVQENNDLEKGYLILSTQKYVEAIEILRKNAVREGKNRAYIKGLTHAARLAIQMSSFISAEDPDKKEENEADGSHAPEHDSEPGADDRESGV